MYVYIIGAKDGPFKIGVAKDVKKRLKNLQTGSYSRLYIHAVKKCNSREEARSVELSAHISLSTMKMTGEWFSCALTDAIYATDASEEEIILNEEDAISAVCKKDLGLAYLKTLPQTSLDYLAKYHGLTSATAESINDHILAKYRQLAKDRRR